MIYTYFFVYFSRRLALVTTALFSTVLIFMMSTLLPDSLRTNLGNHNAIFMSLFPSHGTKEILASATPKITFLTDLGLLSGMSFGENVSGHSSPGNEARHLLFLKVHKAASTTILNMVLRFAMSRQLNVMLPRFRNTLSEHYKNWSTNAISLPPGAPFFDVLCNHLVFDETEVRKCVHQDATFVGIVRHPLDQFESAFNYYRNIYPIQYLKDIPGPNPMFTYIKDPWVWESKDITQSFTHNRMSFDFGMEMDHARNETYVDSYISYLQQTFHLVLLTERFDESVILMRRLLGWNIQDVLYLRSNAFNKTAFNSTGYSFTEDDKFIHRRFNKADYALYETFSGMFKNKLSSQDESFFSEVAYFRRLINHLSVFCQSSVHPAMLVGATEWHRSFAVTKKDCELMCMEELVLVDMVRTIQLNRSSAKIAN